MRFIIYRKELPLLFLKSLIKYEINRISKQKKK